MINGASLQVREPATSVAPVNAIRRVPTWALQWSAAAGTLAIVEVLSRSGVLTEHIPPPTAVIGALADAVSNLAVWSRIADTMMSWAGGLLIAITVGVPTGMLIGSSQRVYGSLRLVIEFLRPIPPIAVLPLAVLLYGSGIQMKIYLVAFSAFWIVLFQTLYGVRDVDPVARDTVRAYGLKRSDQFRRVVLPSAAFYIATGLRLAAAVGLIVTIATELIVGSSGIGYAINQERFAGNAAAMYALVVIAGLIGVAVGAGLRVLERRVLHWHSAHRKGENS
ncbi:ABC transporter permease [Arthrobacter sp. CAU 1506]|uniref:ABC transporter permease n=1 Tax=Arthrobacter sp. CAU 1506 TaxID=2560052 RepID=UPI00145D3D6F|nr:ABC transporter permease [Arthrobacter sp. CAU 1506]